MTDLGLMSKIGRSSMPLYKYVSTGGLEILTGGMIRFCSPAELNDPFELKPHVSAIASEHAMHQELLAAAPLAATDALREIPQELRPLIDENQLLSAMLAQIERQRSSLSKLANDQAQEFQKRIERKLEETIGVLSLTENPTSLLMWAHYADSHRGFVIEFDKSSAFFNQKRREGDEMWQLRKVIYSQHRPEVNLLEAESFSPFLTKGEEWQYEAEWRMMAPLESADRICGDRNELHLFRFPASAIRAVILGARASSDLREAIREAIVVNEEYRHVNLYEAKVDSAHYKIHIHPIGI